MKWAWIREHVDTLSPDTKSLKPLKDACKWNHLKVHLCAEKVGIKLIVCHTKHAILKYLRNLFRNSRTSREVYNYGICNLFETVVKLIGSVVGPY